MNTSFLLHIMLSLGCFDTEVDITLHSSLHECLKYCGDIGPNEDEQALK